VLVSARGLNGERQVEPGRGVEEDRKATGEMTVLVRTGPPPSRWSPILLSAVDGRWHG
jgi:hypothetical protein